jgi:predicted nucleic acid-binding protein
MSKTPLKCMLDTNVFNRILDGKASLELFGEYIIPYATHVQRDELEKTPDEKKREALLQIFHATITSSVETESFALDISRLDEAKLSEDRMIPTSSFIWDVSKWGECTWSGAESLCSTLKAELDSLKVNPNNAQDALIADTAIRGRYVLVTDDVNLTKVTKKHGGTCLSVKELGAQSLLQIKGGNDGTKR